jgi:hypothetical protein
VNRTKLKEATAFWYAAVDRGTAFVKTDIENRQLNQLEPHFEFELAASISIVTIAIAILILFSIW